MGYKLVQDVMDNAPQMTLAEWKAMVVLAEDANDASRLTWSPTTADKITRRLGLAPHAWANLRGALVRKGLLEVVEAGRKGHCAKYRFPRWPAASAAGTDHAPASGLEPNAEPFREASVTPRASLVDDSGTEIRPLAEDENELIRPPGEDANAEYVLQEVNPTHYPNWSEQIASQNQSSASQPTFLVGPPTAGDAGAPPRPEVSIDEDDEPALRVTRTDPVTLTRRIECNRYVELVHRLDGDAVSAALLEFHKERPKMWRWAWNKAADAYGAAQVPPGCENDYKPPLSTAHGRLIYEKALRLSSKNPGFEPALIAPLEQVATTRQPPSWAAA